MPQGDGPAAGVYALLKNEGQFSDVDLAQLERDQPVGRVLRDTDKREIAVFGAVKVRTPGAFLLTRIRDIVGFKQNPMVLQIGRLGTPPRVEDLAGLTLERDDVEALKRCHPDDCGLRLPAAEMDRIRTAINANPAEATQTATRLMREFLVHHAQTYLAGGAAALPPYRDKKSPTSVAEQFDRLLAWPRLLGGAPAFQRYVQQFPSEEPRPIETFLYWSKERFGFKPVISLTQVMIHTPRERGLINAYVASKQIYASHYFDASLAVTAVVDAPAGNGAPVFYMMYLNRSRTPMLEGFFAALAKGAVRSRTRDGMVETLRVTKQRLESAYQR